MTPYKRSKHPEVAPADERSPETDASAPDEENPDEKPLLDGRGTRVSADNHRRRDLILTTPERMPSEAIGCELSSGRLVPTARTVIHRDLVDPVVRGQ